MILAPLRGVTIRCFREVFARPISEVGFTEAITPFITAVAGYDPLKDRELFPFSAAKVPRSIKVTAQVIGKDPAALKAALAKIKAAGFDTADLNCGCPFPMVRNKGRGSGILRTPETLERMIAAGCEVMGAGRFSIKARLGVERNDELLSLMPIINNYPLRFLTVHARNAKQMYAGECDRAAFDAVKRAAKVPLVYNGDVELPVSEGADAVMVGRGFLRYLGGRDDIGEYLERYIEASKAELFGERPVLGRMKELLAYWKDMPRWSRRWQVAKLARSLDELRSIIV